jgi:hypothetical protein
MIRRSLLKHLAALPLFATATFPSIGAGAAKLKIMIKVRGDRTIRQRPHFRSFMEMRFPKAALKFKSFARRSGFTDAQVGSQCGRSC